MAALFPARSEWAYHAEALKARAGAKLAKLDRFGLLSGCGRAVDLGAGTGDFVAALAGRGIAAAGVERNPQAVTNGLRELGRDVNGLCLGDAAAMPFASGVFDLATAWDTHEHLPDPRAVNGDAHRCLRAGGRYYINSGPLYTSPWGGHLYRQIRIPWAHLLFEDDVLAEYLTQAGYGHHQNNPYCDHPSRVWLNRLPLSYFRDLLHDGEWEVLHWFEAPVSDHERRLGESIRDLLDDRSDEELFTASFEAVLRKR
ncbi:MAG: class I SAM-dependent methyltransferase [bacterium]|nr:class I SAM-dependent methyltransferase [bacterium]